MNRSTSFAVIFIALLLFCSSTLSQLPMLSIPITNADFEAPLIAGGSFQAITDPAGCGVAFNGQIAGWMLTPVQGGAGGGGVAHWTCDDGMPNSNVAFLSGGKIEQLTAEKARQGIYVLQFDVKDWFYSYSGDWNAALYTGITDTTGNMTLSQAPFCSESSWSLGDMKRITVVCPLSGGFINPGNVNPDGSLSIAGQIAGNVVIHFQNGGANPALGGHAGWPILIDNVSLTFTPSD